MKILTKLAVSFAIVTSGFGLATAGIAIAGDSAHVISSADQNRKTPDYLRNASGQTYGSLSDANVDTDAPDLIAAIGTNGVKGYLRSIDLLVPLPKSPEQAIAEQNARPKQRLLNLYAADGTTVLGEYVSGSLEQPTIKP